MIKYVTTKSFMTVDSLLWKYEINNQINCILAKHFTHNDPVISLKNGSFSFCTSKKIFSLKSEIIFCEYHLRLVAHVAKENCFVFARLFMALITSVQKDGNEKK